MLRLVHAPPVDASPRRRVLPCFDQQSTQRTQLEVTGIPTHVVGTRHFIPGFMRDSSGEQPAIVRGGAVSSMPA